jgi:hypothetical protein
MTERVFFPVEDLRELMDVEFVNKSKINCIKHIRAMTGLGLKEAKDFFEQEWIHFVNGERQPPKQVETLITDCPEFQELQRQVAKLTEEVEDLRSNQNRTRAKTIFTEKD